MANDAKLGLVLGVAVVLIIGLVFFRTEPLSANLPAASAQQRSHNPKNAARPFYPSVQIDAAQAR